MKAELVLRRLGFSGAEIADMSGTEAAAWLETYSGYGTLAANGKDSPVTYRVGRGPESGPKRRRK